MTEPVGSILTYFFLTLAVLSLWVRRHPAWWGGLLALSLGTGLLSGRVTLPGAVAILLMGSLVKGYYRPNQPLWAKAIRATGVLTLGLALFLHRVPGFDNWKVIGTVALSPDALPYTAYLNFDKTAVGLLLLAFGPELARTRRDWKTVGRFLARWIWPGAVCILLLSLALGYLRWDPKFPEFFAPWLFKMLVFTCVAEEVLFRGFIQKELVALLEGRRRGPTFAVAAASVLFGLAHFSGGPKYVLLATVAGMFYGWAYHKTGRIETSILFHCLLNTAHLLLFSYPALRSAFPP